MSTTIPALSSVTDILDSDLVMITHSNGESFKIAGSEINKRNQAVIAPDATPTVLTGAPLKTGNIVRVYWKVDVTGANTSTGLTLNYNSVNYSVKVPRNGTLANLTAIDLGGSPAVYKYLQAYTTLELLYDGTQFILLGNPVLISTANYTYTADGKGIIDDLISGDKHAVTSAVVYKALQPATTEIDTGIKWINGKNIYRRVFVCSQSGHLTDRTWTLLNQYFSGLSDLAAIIADLIDVKFSDGTLCMNAQWIEKYGNDFEIYPVVARDIVYHKEFLIFEYTKA